MITRYGRDVVVTELVIAAVAAAAVLLAPAIAARVMVWGIAAFGTAFTLYFFRDPDRTVPPDAAVGNVVVSPGDGKVVSIVTTTSDTGFFDGPVIQVSVFLSPLNVHVNRIPITGTVAFFRYVKGEYIVAFHEKASERNERTEIGIDTGTGRVLFKQIAGYVARRIVCPLQVGDRVTIGERFGMIKFGSRVDILMPVTSDIRVKVGDVVTGGESIVGVLK